MKTLAMAAILAALVPAAQASNHQHDHALGATAASAAAYTDGEVRKVDAKSGKVTLKHGAIDNIGMPPMTMAFAVRDPALLKGLKEGDKVQFKADKVGETFTVTEIRKKG